jgi:hypothetical protein
VKLDGELISRLKDLVVRGIELPLTLALARERLMAGRMNR